MIVVRGRNLHPQDIELTVESSDPAVRRGGCIAFGVEGSSETRVSVVASLGRLGGRKPEDVLNAIRDSLFETHEVQPYSITLVTPGSLPRTSSGKVQRDRCRRMFLEGGLATISEWRNT
jgi:acyl-CoA synthetase (AMP-forming)/AMP-acid ligase II